MHPEKTQAETRDKPQIDLAKDFFLKFRGVVLTNSEGKKIELKIRQENHSLLIHNKEKPSSDRAKWILEFSGFDPKGAYNPEDNIPQNFIEFESNTDESEIEISYAKLTAPDLLGKKNYEQILQLVGKFFPENFKLYSVIQHPKTREEILLAIQLYENGKISTDQMENLIANSNLVSKTIKAGFNHFSFLISQDDGKTIYETAEKRPEQEGVIIEIN